ncbi:MAG: hypothetical protein JWO38_8248 [Gemmataceae bacterium]|nr:hypothetical protein [Gemmataceae bacterium]
MARYSRGRRALGARPRLERLEDRATPATLLVTNLADSGGGSLRDAIDQANLIQPTSSTSSSLILTTIRFAPSLAGQTIDLSTVGDQSIGPSAFLVRSGLIIEGSGQTITRSPTAGDFRLFAVTGVLAIENLTLSNGSAVGGAGGMGGGGAAGLGGAVYNRGTFFAINSTLTGNRAVGGVNFNPANGGGGGLGGPGDGSGDDGPPNGDTGPGAGFGGGGRGNTGLAGDPGGFGGGGGRGAFGGGGGGGGRSNPAAVPAPGFSGSAFGGGQGTYMSGGSGAGMGGAIFNEGRTVSLFDSTITGNTAEGGYAPGAGAGDAFGGGIFNLDGTVNILSSTVAANTVVAGPGTVSGEARGGELYNLSLNVPPTVSGDSNVTISNSILGDTAGSSVDVVNDQENNRATISALGPNLITSAVDNLGGTLSGTPFTVGNPLLGPLQNNGGFTPTMLPQMGSPAIDAGSNADLNPLGSIGGTDQRGGHFVRVANRTVDLGAVEVQPPPTATGEEVVVSGRANGSAQGYTPDLSGLLQPQGGPWSRWSASAGSSAGWWRT